MRILSFLFFLAAASLANAQIYQHDISADTVLQPPIRGFINLPTSVYIKFTNKGTSDEINVKLFVRITNYLNKLVYADTQSIDSLWLSGQTKKIAFRDFTPPGLHGYEVTAIAVLLGDQNNFNDTAFSSFCVGYESDVAALSITNPTKNEVKPIKALFQPQGIFWVPGGCFDFTNIPVRVQIVRCSDDQLVFRADTIMPNIPLDSAGASISFPYKQGNYNIQNLAIGCYRITIIANKPDDGDRTNDTAYSNFFIGSGDYILAEGFESPQPDAHLNRDSSIPITAQFKNIGIYPETRVIVGVDVQDRKGNMIMQDSSIQTNWSINESRTITFKSFSSSSNGTFTITAWTYIGNGTGVRINIGDQCDIAVLSVQIHLLMKKFWKVWALFQQEFSDRKDMINI